MKSRNGIPYWLVLGFIWSIFMGITAVSIGIGSLAPQLNSIAGPFVCPNGRMQVDQQVDQVSPVETVTTLTYYCVDAQSGAKTELNPFTSINLYAGVIYGLLIFLVVLIIWYFNRSSVVSRESPETRKWLGRIGSGLLILVIGGILVFQLAPVFRSITATPVPVPTPELTATALANTYETLTSGQPVVFDSTDKPLSSWNDIPIMPQATAGRQVDDTRYAFRVPEDSGTIESFYKNSLNSLGWSLADSRFMGLEFTRGKVSLLVTLAPDNDLQSYVVTLVLIP